MSLNFMNKFFNKILKNEPQTVEENHILNEFIDTQNEMENLPQLSAVEKVQFEHDTSIGHLYYSSKIEGSNLDSERLNEAIHA